MKLHTSRPGMTPAIVIARDQEARWEICSTGGVLRSNWRIIMAPMSLLDDAVVQELMRLAGRREHAARFRATIVADRTTNCAARLRREDARYAVS